MFVDLMTDLRKTVSSFFFRAQFGPPQPRRQVQQRLAYSGPTEASAGGGLGEQAQLVGQQAAARPGGSGVDELGMSARATAGAAGIPAGPDPRQLSTNRGEQVARKPVTVDKAPGRNAPCPCGSGKKYKKCHGR